MIPGAPLAISMHYSNKPLSIRVSEVCGASKPPVCLGIVAINAFTLRVHEADSILGSGVAILCQGSQESVSNRPILPVECSETLFSVSCKRTCAQYGDENTYHCIPNECHQPVHDLSSLAAKPSSLNARVAKADDRTKRNSRDALPCVYLFLEK
jgi:hypothetical protein